MALTDATIQYVAELAFVIFPILIFGLSIGYKMLENFLENKTLKTRRRRR